MKSFYELGFTVEDLAEKQFHISKMSNFPFVEILSQQQWQELLSIYNYNNPDSSIPIDLDSDGDEENKESTNGQTENVFIVSLQLFESNGERKVHCKPPRCELCCSQIDQQKKKAELLFKDEEIIVKLLRDKRDLIVHAPGSSSSSSSASSSSTVGTERTRAIRAGRAEAVYKIRVDAEDRLSMLKLRLYEIITTKDLPPSRQRLYDQAGKELKADSSNLMECGIRAGDTLLLLPATKEELEAEGDCDVWDDVQMHSSIWEFEDSKTSKRGPEKGFGGTFLDSGKGNSDTGKRIEIDVVDITGDEEEDQGQGQGQGQVTNHKQADSIEEVEDEIFNRYEQLKKASTIATTF